MLAPDFSKGSGACIDDLDHYGSSLWASWRTWTWGKTKGLGDIEGEMGVGKAISPITIIITGAPELTSSFPAHVFLVLGLTLLWRELDTWSWVTSSLHFSLLLGMSLSSDCFTSSTFFRTMPQWSCCGRKATLQRSQKTLFSEWWIQLWITYTHGQASLAFKSSLNSRAKGSVQCKELKVPFHSGYLLAESPPGSSYPNQTLTLLRSLSFFLIF